MELLKPQDAARLMSVSYPTIKQWIYNGKVHSVKTPGGHHRIPRSEIERFSTTTQ
jgi:excisionase family DNA binding protein